MTATRINLCCAAVIGLTACGSASAGELTPDNPAHCLMVFHTYHLAAKAQGNERVARGMDARVREYASLARTLPAEERSIEVMTRAAEQLIALEDAGLALSTECMKRQNARLGIKDR